MRSNEFIWLYAVCTIFYEKILDKRGALAFNNFNEKPKFKKIKCGQTNSFGCMQYIQYFIRKY